MGTDDRYAEYVKEWEAWLEVQDDEIRELALRWPPWYSVEIREPGHPCIGETGTIESYRSSTCPCGPTLNLVVMRGNEIFRCVGVAEKNLVKLLTN